MRGMMPETPPSLAEALRLGRVLLPADDAGAVERWLLAVLGQPRTRLFTHPEQRLDGAQWQRFRDGLARLAGGEPVAYLIGWQPFWRFDLAVDPAVLIPRPDTERLVELAVQRLPADAATRVADLGTGSGAIALAIAQERPRASVLAVERSAPALRVAAGNRKRLGLANVLLLQGDWGSALGGGFDLIASNPPYLAEDDPHFGRDGLDREPRAALAAGHDGLDDLRRIVADAPRLLRPGGWLLLEHGHSQGAAVRALLAAVGLVEVATERDYGGRERVSLGRRAAAPT
jgi:release factor glutamine methyltransferase